MASALAKAQVQEDAFCETEQGSEAAAGANTASVETAVIQAQDAGVGTQDASCYDDTDNAQEREDEDDKSEELLSVLDQALKEVRHYLDDKLKLKTLSEVLDEL